jgi:hypothetical protein
MLPGPGVIDNETSTAVSNRAMHMEQALGRSAERGLLKISNAMVSMAKLIYINCGLYIAVL